MKKVRLGKALEHGETWAIEERKDLKKKGQKRRLDAEARKFRRTQEFPVRIRALKWGMKAKNIISAKSIIVYFPEEIPLEVIQKGMDVAIDQIFKKRKS